MFAGDASSVGFRRTVLVLLVVGVFIWHQGERYSRHQEETLKAVLSHIGKMQNAKEVNAVEPSTDMKVVESVQTQSVTLDRVPPVSPKRRVSPAVVKRVTRAPERTEPPLKPDLRRAGTEPGTTPSTILPWEIDMSGATPSYLVPKRNKACIPGPNYPNINFDYWKTRPNYQKFLDAHNEIVGVAEQLQEAVTAGDNLAARTALNQLLDLSSNVQANVLRKNPIDIGDDNNAHPSVYFLMVQTAAVTSSDVLAIVNRKLFWGDSRFVPCAYNFSERLYASIREGKTRYEKDPHYRPQHFIDLGARYYTPATLQPKYLPVPIPDSSTRVFELWYPGFKDMHASVFDIGPTFINSYKQLFQTHRNMSFYNFASWVHEDGVQIENYLMQQMAPTHTTKTASSGRAAAQMSCVETIDTATFLRQHPDGSVLLKMDIEWAEWQVLEHLDKENVWPVIGEIYLECHRLDWQLFPMSSSKIGANVNSLLNAVEGHGMDCLMVHDYLRSKGVVTHFWP